MIKRKIKRNILKKQLVTNNISDAFHNEYGYTPNIKKISLLEKERVEHKKRKLKHKKARLKRKKESE